MGAANRDQARGEGDQRSVGGAPVDRARRVVLGVGVVVAALAEAELRAHASIGVPREASNSVSRLRSSRERCSTIPGSSLGPSTPWFQLRLLSVPSRVLAVGLVVLVVVGDKVAEGEAVVGDDEIDAFGRRRRAREHVARAGDPGRDLAARSRVAAPESARGVAETVVPFANAGPNWPSR